MMGTSYTQPSIGQAPESIATIDWATLRQTFQQYTTPTGAAQILRSCLPELCTRSFKISDCTILDARLKTYVNPTSKDRSTLSACYGITLQEGSIGPSSHCIFYAKAFLGGRSTEAFQQLPHRGMSDGEFRHTVTHVPEHDLILWRFPHDPALPHLRHLVDLPTVEQFLPLDGLRQIGMQKRTQVLARHLVNYRPEIRCTNRYDLYDSTQDRTCRLFGKTFRNSDGYALYERLQFFWDRSLADSHIMAVAQPLGYAAPVNTVWQLGVPGTSLLNVLNASTYKHYIASVAKGLASLHTSDVTGLATHSPADHLVEIHKKLTKLSDAIPWLSQTFGKVADDIEGTAPHSSTIPFRPIHWDFHIDQLLADNGKLTFCDLDELVIGDPLQDLANFMVDLHFRHVDQALVGLIMKDLCRQYQQLVDWSVPVNRLAWHIRIQFVNKAYRHYLRFSPGFENAVEQILRFAERGFTL